MCIDVASEHAEVAACKYYNAVHVDLCVCVLQYIIIGSANINQRSMDGSRDTEIAMGAFQPNHCIGNSHGNYPRGQVRSPLLPHLGS